MGSSRRSGLPLKGRINPKPVWVDLRGLFPTTASTAAEGLIVDEVVPGALHSWHRTTSGDWIGVVTFTVRTSNGGSHRAEDQLIPAQALSPR